MAILTLVLQIVLKLLFKTCWGNKADLTSHQVYFSHTDFNYSAWVMWASRYFYCALIVNWSDSCLCWNDAHSVNLGRRSFVIQKQKVKLCCSRIWPKPQNASLIKRFQLQRPLIIFSVWRAELEQKSDVLRSVIKGFMGTNAADARRSNMMVCIRPHDVITAASWAWMRLSTTWTKFVCRLIWS